jgi:hypothetical protein
VVRLHPPERAAGASKELLIEAGKYADRVYRRNYIEGLFLSSRISPFRVAKKKRKLPPVPRQ